MRSISIEAVEELSHLKGEPDWLRQKRLAAFKIFTQAPLPQSRYTQIKGFDFNRININPYSQEQKRLDGLPEEFHHIIAEQKGPSLVQIDSQVVQVEVKLPEDLKRKGLIFTDLDTAIREYPELVRQYFMQAVQPADKFTALHLAFTSSGLFLYIPRGIEIKVPLTALFLLDTPNGGAFIHVLIIAEPGSKLTYIEEFHSTKDSRGLHTGVAEVYLKEGAEVKFASLQNWGPQIISFVTRRALLAREAKISWAIGFFGGKLTKSYLENALIDRGASAEDFQIFFGSQLQHFELTSALQNKSPLTSGEIEVRGILADRASAVNYGLIKVDKAAQFSDSYQGFHTMLLNPGAKAEAIPSLEIEAHEVRATHGATVGPIDEEQVFYLRSRGLNEDQAERMIVEGFFEPVLSRIPLPLIQKRIKRLMEIKWT